MDIRINEEQKFTVLAQDGKELECEALFRFEDSETQKNYIVYTDNSIDEEGNTRVFASTYEPNATGKVKLMPIESEKEWTRIEKILSAIQESVREQINSETALSAQQGTDNDSNISKSNFKTEPNNTDILLEGLIDDLTERILKEFDPDIAKDLFDIFCEASGNNYASYSLLGYKAFAQNNYIVSEMAFRRSISLCDDENLIIKYKSILSFLIRHNKIKTLDQKSAKEIALLLRQGVECRDSSSLINMALLWSTEFGTDSDWEMADNLIRYVDKAKSEEVFNLWLELARKGDPEGFLVHYILLRHGIINSSPLGDLNTLFTKVKELYPRIPKKLHGPVGQ